MQEFSFSDLSRIVGQIVDAAMLGPVALTKHGRRKLVMLPAAEYDQLLASARSGSVGENNAAITPKPAGRKSPLSGLGQRTVEDND